jgi:uncharacterized membrane protein
MATENISGDDASPEKKNQTAGIFELAATIFWSFLGVRKRSDYEQDAVRISLKQVVVAGVIGGILFVVGVIFLVKAIMAHLGASTA